MPQDLQLRRPFDRRGFREFTRNTQEKLAQKKNEESVAKKTGNDERQESIGPVQLRKHDEQRDHGDLKRKHQRRQGNDEENLAGTPLDARKTVSNQSVRAKRSEDAEYGHDEGVFPVLQ